jgi:hypothetical protein
MTESDIGSDKHKRPSSADIDIAVLKERYRESARRDETIMSQLDTIIGKLSLVERGMAVGEQRFDRIEENVTSVRQQTTAAIAAVTGRVDAIEADKRGVAGIVAGVLSFIGVAALAVREWLK